jgi:hypothetical protein
MPNKSLCIGPTPGNQTTMNTPGNQITVNTRLLWWHVCGWGWWRGGQEAARHRWAVRGETRRRGGCSGREPARSGGKWRGWWGNWRDMGKTDGNALVSLARGPRASDWRCREVPALPIGSCRTGAGTGAPAHLLGSPMRRRDFGVLVRAGFWPRA